MARLAALLLAFLLAGTTAAVGEDVAYPPVLPGTRLAFPRDHGAHPAHRVEWWYLTGSLQEAGGGAPLGFQITFFRLRPGVQEDNPSAFATRQLLFAHAALADPRQGRLLHAQKAARAGFGLARAAEGDTDVAIDDWSLQRSGAAGDERYALRAGGEEFGFDLVAMASALPLLQGEAGVSRKGADPRHASHYYSRPQLTVSGTVRLHGRPVAVSGRAWLDHEWSSAYLPEGAVGWDWTGVNLDDGGALMAFRMRGQDGEALWAGGLFAPAGGTARTLGPDEIAFTPRRRWQSPRTGASYPVEMQVAAGGRQYLLSPLLDDQELDTRLSVGAVYWEGAVRARDEAGREVGRGYLELTGYAGRLRF